MAYSNGIKQANHENMKTVVYQSYRNNDVPDWIALCLQSVQSWADRIGADYRFYGDELFDRVPAWYLNKTKDRLVVATDLGRLMLAKELLAEGYDRVVWLDADMLVFAPECFDLKIDTQYAFGREVWIQRDEKDRLKAYRKIHNAFFVFTQENSFLDFYIHSCLSIIQRIEGHMVPQIVGPKFLTAIHNIVACPVVEEAGMCSPLVIRDILKGGGPALDLFHQESPSCVFAVNMSASLEGVELSAQEMERVCRLLLARKEL